MNIDKVLGKEILDNALKSDVRLFGKKVELTDEDIKELKEL